MPGGPDYPHDTSQRYPKFSVVVPHANDPARGVLHGPDGDLHNWVTVQEVYPVHRDLVTALAYLDVADILSDTRHKELSMALAALASTVGQLNAAVVEQGQLIQALVNQVGVIVPAWQTLAEVNEGDDMGLVRPSARQLSLTANIVALQREPGFGHEQVVSITPPAGTLVPRGTVVEVEVNFLG